MLQMTAEQVDIWWQGKRIEKAKQLAQEWPRVNQEDREVWLRLFPELLPMVQARDSSQGATE